MPLNLLYTMVQKSQKWPKTQIKGGPALIVNSLLSGSFQIKFSAEREENLTLIVVVFN